MGVLNKYLTFFTVALFPTLSKWSPQCEQGVVVMRQEAVMS